MPKKETGMDVASTKLPAPHGVRPPAEMLFYYDQVLDLSGTLSGAAIFIALCVDAAGS